MIVDDDQAICKALVTLIDGSPGFVCGGSFRSVEDALDADSNAVDVVLLDISLPGMTGPDGIAPLKGHWPSAEIIMLTVFADDARIFASICQGAVGYLLKKTPAVRLLAAVREAALESQHVVEIQ